MKAVFFKILWKIYIFFDFTIFQADFTAAAILFNVFNFLLEFVSMLFNTVFGGKDRLQVWQMSDVYLSSYFYYNNQSGIE